MRRIADLPPGHSKTDTRDAYVIADAARTMPHTLSRVGADDETLSDLSLVAGYDDDLAGQTTRLTNRLRDALCTSILPWSPRGLRKALRELGAHGIGELMRLRSLQMARTPTNQISPATRRSRSSIKGETRSQRGNHALKSPLFMSAFASLADPTRPSYYG